LDLSNTELTNEDANCLRKALCRRQLKSLEKLKVARISTKLTESGLNNILTTFEVRTAPNLKHLDLSHNVWGYARNPLHPIATALVAGLLPNLQELNLSYPEETRRGWFKPIIEAMIQGGCPKLRKLLVYACPLMPADGRGLGMVLRSGACPKLDTLGLSHNRHLGNDGMVAIAQGLESKNCKELKRLELAHMEVQAPGGEAFARALERGGFNKLQWLDISNFCLDSVATRDIMRSLHHLTGLRKLNVSETATTSMWPSLASEIKSGACPNLEVLLASDCNGHTEGIAQLLRALGKNGGRPELRELTLANVGMTEQAAMALAETLSHSSLPGLEKVDLSANIHIGDKGMAAILEGLGSKRCMGLKVFAAIHTGMEDEAGLMLVNCLRDGSWPVLESLVVENKSSSDEWLSNLAVNLHNGAGRCLKSLSLLLSCSAPGAFHRLAIALRQGACPQLTGLWLGTSLSKTVANACRADLKDSVSIRKKVEVRLGRRYKTANSYVYTYH